MVVWVYAGGGQSEAFGLVPFLEKHLSGTFERRTPRRLPGPRPGSPVYPGSTGKTLAREIQDDIKNYWTGAAEVILVVDDTDENDPQSHLEMLKAAVVCALAARGISTASDGLPVIIGMAVPEIESWPLADWDHTFKIIYRECHAAVQYELSTHWRLDFAAPEKFPLHDDAGRYQKLSEIIKEAIRLKCVNRLPYSKSTDTPRLLSMANPAIISQKCPCFRRFWTELEKQCPAA